MSTLAPTTVLEAINAMLAGIGESPVNTVQDSGSVDAVTALSTLQNVSRELQKTGWHWNTEKALLLTPNLDGDILVPNNTLKVDSTSIDTGIDVIQRGQRLYNRTNHTYTFTKAILADLVVLLPFTDIPETARSLITMRSIRRFQENSVGSDTLASFQRSDEARAWAELIADEAETQDFNILDNSAIREVMAR